MEIGEDLLNFHDPSAVSPYFHLWAIGMNVENRLENADDISRILRKLLTLNRLPKDLLNECMSGYTFMHQARLDGDNPHTLDQASASPLSKMNGREMPQSEI